MTPELSIEPEEIPLDILYEDDHLLAVNKPAGMVVHPGAGNPSHTFVNALLFHCKNLEKSGSNLRPRNRTPFGQRYLGSVARCKNSAGP